MNKNITENDINIYLPYFVDEDDLSVASASAVLEPSQSLTLSIILYKGLALGTFDTDAIGDIDIVVTGNVEVDEYKMINATGDGSVTFSIKK